MIRIIPGLVAALFFFTHQQTFPAGIPAAVDSLRWELLLLEPPGEDNLQQIAAAGFEIIGRQQDGSIRLLAAAGRRAWFREHGLAFEVLSEDYGRSLVQENLGQAEPAAADDFAAGSMGGYFSPEETAALVDSLAAADPYGIISGRIEIGRSLWDQPIWMVRVSDNAALDEDEPEVFYNSLIHAREAMGLMTLMYFLRYLVQNYALDDSVRALVDSRELYFVPVVNPDGYEINWRIFSENQAFGLWRKNARDNDGNGELNDQDGVDLNRNFDFQWGYDNRGSSGIFLQDNYRGTSPFSEPESVVLRDFIAERGLVAAVNYHSYAGALINPFGYTDKLTPDSLLYLRLGELLTADNHYIFGNAPRTLGPTYRVNGEMTDWMYGDTLSKGRIFAWAAEIGSDQDGFWPAQSRITPLAALHLPMNLWLARLSGFWPVVDSLVVSCQGDDPCLVEVAPVLSNPGLAPSGGEVALRVESSGPGLEVLDSLVVFPMLGRGSPPLRADGRLRFRFSGNLAETSVMLVLSGQETAYGSFPLVLTRQVEVSYDLNGDGQVNIFDLLSMLQALSSGIFSTDQVRACDLNADGAMDIFDLLSLLNELSLQDRRQP